MVQTARRRSGIARNDDFLTIARAPFEWHVKNSSFAVCA